jgi:hypothetical protein
MSEIVISGKVFQYQIVYKNNKNIYLRVKDDSIQITMSKAHKNLDVQELLLKHSRFILKNSTKTHKIKLYDRKKMLLFGEDLFVEIGDFKKVMVSDKSICVPNSFSERIIENFYREELLTRVKEMLKEIKIPEINFDNVVFKARLMKTRLGSCNKKSRVINLNTILARFDEVYLRSVLIHELVHLVISNHQKPFYEMVSRYDRDYLKNRKNINNLIKRFEI